MGHCNFMAWHTLRDALKMTGRSRSQFYRDMRSGLVSYRTSQDGRREFETSELIRAYGELKQMRHKKGTLWDRQKIHMISRQNAFSGN